LASFVVRITFAWWGSLPLEEVSASEKSRGRVTLKSYVWSPTPWAELPPETVVYPGHGPATTIGRELATNPFLNGGARVLGG